MKGLVDLDENADLLRVLGHRVRLRLLAALIGGELVVGDIEAATKVGQPMLSQQLGLLRKARLVKARRVAKQVFYRLDHERIRQVGELLDRFAGTPSPEQDARVRLQRGGSVAMFARIG